MKSKFIFESLEDVLKPKSEEEIINELEKICSCEILIKSGEIGYLNGFKKALKNEADIY